MSIVLYSAKDQLKVNCHAWLEGYDVLKDYGMNKLEYTEEEISKQVEENDDDDEIVSILVEYLTHSRHNENNYSIYDSNSVEMRKSNSQLSLAISKGIDAKFPTNYYPSTIQQQLEHQTMTQRQILSKLETVHNISFNVSTTAKSDVTFPLHSFQKCFFASRQLFLNAIATIIITISKGSKNAKFWKHCTNKKSTFLSNSKDNYSDDRDEGIPILSDDTHEETIQNQHCSLSIDGKSIGHDIYNSNILASVSWWYKMAQMHSQINKVIFFDRYYYRKCITSVLEISGNYENACFELPLSDNNTSTVLHSNQLLLKYWAEDESTIEKVTKQQHNKKKGQQNLLTKNETNKKSKKSKRNRRRRSHSKRIIKSYQGKLIILELYNRKQKKK